MAVERAGTFPKHVRIGEKRAGGSAIHSKVNLIRLVGCWVLAAVDSADATARSSSRRTIPSTTTLAGSVGTKHTNYKLAHHSQKQPTARSRSGESARKSALTSLRLKMMGGVHFSTLLICPKQRKEPGNRANPSWEGEDRRRCRPRLGGIAFFSLDRQPAPTPCPTSCNRGPQITGKTNEKCIPATGRPRGDFRGAWRRAGEASVGRSGSQLEGKGERKKAKEEGPLLLLQGQGNERKFSVLHGLVEATTNFELFQSFPLGPLGPNKRFDTEAGRGKPPRGPHGVRILCSAGEGFGLSADEVLRFAIQSGLLSACLEGVCPSLAAVLSPSLSLIFRRKQQQLRVTLPSLTVLHFSELLGRCPAQLPTSRERASVVLWLRDSIRSSDRRTRALQTNPPPL